MAELDEKLAAMMADPNIMAQVAAMAKSLGMAPPGPGETPPEAKRLPPYQTSNRHRSSCRPR